ncbi:3-dehydroquinate synthase [Candidatus Izemoplasma sp. B36]|uniref:3-dehydroquinate synthase n=1 Tax=Candidatus Izemoplasma sp. B36 TaxID=3242468 RepID=UPI0035571A4E
MKKIDVRSKLNNYSIIIENNLLNRLEDYFDNEKFYVIIHDDHIPKEYINKIRMACKNNLIINFPEGEKSKSFSEYERIISIMQKNNIKRDACIVAVGGGVTGDLSGFIASTYLRGIGYIQVPTSLLSQIDSSVGGKVAINTDYAKNSVGSFYPPSIVLIDPLTLKTLPKRHFNNGMAEGIKYGMIYSKTLFDRISNKNIEEDLETFIYDCLMIKKYFVENDEFDSSIRQMLNFGHTYGHAYERYYNFNKYLHGEAVALGMIKSTRNTNAKNNLISVLKKYNLPISDKINEEDIVDIIKKDKKNTSKYLNMIYVDTIGEANIVKQLFRR